MENVKRPPTADPSCGIFELHCLNVPFSLQSPHFLVVDTIVEVAVLAVLARLVWWGMKC